MGHLSSGCHTCGKDCIDVEFCSEGASFDNDGKGIKLPKSLKVKIVANPDYWGFGGVLTSGYVTFNQGHYDYFEGYDENWWGTAACEDGSIQASRNEKRPDVTYRSVFDPDTGLTTHYDGTDVETDNRGGAVYLILSIESRDKLVLAVQKIQAHVLKQIPQNLSRDSQKTLAGLTRSILILLFIRT